MSRNWLKEFRRERGLQIREVSKEIGISVSYYSQIENGKRNCPVPTAKKIAAALGFDWQRFYEDTVEPAEGA